MHLSRFQREGRTADLRTLIPGLRHRKRARSVMKAALGHARGDGPILEFGVFKGRMIRFIAAEKPDVPIFGFDSFEGFPDDGRGDWDQDFRVDKLPEVPGNVTLIKGFFDVSLPKFIEENPALKAPRLVHIDCDLYSSTKTILDHIGHLLGPSSVIVFDELLHYRGFRENEFLAFYEFLEARGLSFRWLAKSGRVMPLDRFQKHYDDHSLPSMQELRKLGYHQNVAVVLEPRSEQYERELARFADAV